MYESPIHIYEELNRQITKDFENQIMVQVNAVVDVNKEELVKALNYDRDQYYKGYESGFNNAEKIYKRALELACKDVNISRLCNSSYKSCDKEESHCCECWNNYYLQKAREE